LEKLFCIEESFQAFKLKLSFQFERRQKNEFYFEKKRKKLNIFKAPFNLDLKGFCNNAKVDLVLSNNIFWKNRLCVSYPSLLDLSSLSGF